MSASSEQTSRRIEQWNEWKEVVKQAASDLLFIADQIGLKRGKEQGAKQSALFHSPAHEDKNPSLSVFKTATGGYAWKDHSTSMSGMDAISLVTYKEGLSFGDAVRRVAEICNVQNFKADNSGFIRVEKTRAEYVAEKVLQGDKDKAIAYLNSRGIDKEIASKAWNKKSLGWNSYTNEKKNSGIVGYGGAGVSFVVRDRFDNKILAVDTRYQEPELNGGVKTNSQGDKEGCPWVLDWYQFSKAHTVCVVESQINALSVLSSHLFGWDSLALRGTANASSVPLEIFKGKMVIIGMDYDEPFGEQHNMAGKRPGPEAGWELYDRLSAAGIPSLLLDQTEWEEGWDINDILQQEGKYTLKRLLQKWETCAISGLMFDGDEPAYPGKRRAWLPKHDFNQYWRYEVQQDFTRYVEEFKRGGDGESLKKIRRIDLAGFRIAQISRVAIQSWQSSVLNAAEGQGDVMFAVSCQTPQHGRILKRLAFNDEQYANPQSWSKFGYIYKPSPFMRLTNILANTLDDGQRLAVNFVGLAYKAGVPIVNEGGDCYFRDANKQCPYSDLIFNSGSKAHAKQIINAFQETFKKNGALIPVVWALGAHLKLFLGFWPHLQMEAEKGSGKSVLMDKMAKALQMQVFGSDMLKTNYRLQHTVSYSGHPVMWEEIGTNKPEVLKEANDKLQEAFNYRHSIRGDLSYLSASPVLLGGEEVDMNSLIGKLTRSSINEENQGPEIAGNLPVFPLREWLEFLSKLDQTQVVNGLNESRDSCMRMAMVDKGDANAKRIVKNFASIRLAWHLLCEFAGLDKNQGNFEKDLIREMNSFLSETKASRQPWVWIVEIILSEIDSKRYMYPLAFDQVKTEKMEHSEPCLLIRHTHMMQHIQHSSHLKQRWDALPIRQAKTFKSQMKKAGVFVAEGYERNTGSKRISGMMAISLERLEAYGMTLGRHHLDTEDD